MSDRGKNRGRMAIYAMAGIYILYMAYLLIKDLPYSSGNQKILMIVFVIFFGVVGAAMVIFGLVKGYQLSRPSGTDESQETEETEASDDAAQAAEETEASDDVDEEIKTL